MAFWTFKKKLVYNIQYYWDLVTKNIINKEEFLAILIIYKLQVDQKEKKEELALYLTKKRDSALNWVM